MGWNQPTVLPYQPTTWETYTRPMLTNLAMAYMKHNWSMDIAEKALEAGKIAATVQQQRAKELETHKATQKGMQTRLTQAAKIQPQWGGLQQGPAGGLWQKGPKGQIIRRAAPGEAKKGIADPTQKDLLARSTTLRKEFIQGSKTFINVRDSFHRVQASAKDPSPAGDLALIFNYMKMLDPESVVRESEFATAAATGSYGERMKAAAAKLLRGEKLSASMREDFRDRASRLMKKQRQSHGQLRHQYTALSKEYKVPAGQVVIDYRMPFEIGAVYVDENGIQKRYLGIDKGWEPIQ